MVVRALLVYIVRIKISKKKKVVYIFKMRNYNLGLLLKEHYTYGHRLRSTESTSKLCSLECGTETFKLKLKYTSNRI